jgi:hypothetical protein
MNWVSSIVVALALAIAPAAVAQEKPATDPARLELARQLVAASGGAETAQKMVQQMYVSLDDVFAKVVPADKLPLFRTMQRDIQAETMKMIPDLMAQSVDIYARVLTEQELRDMVAFQTSETGQAVVRKMPVIMNEIMRAQVPYMQQMMPRLMRKAMDRACEEAKCSPAERKEVADIMAKALGQKPS